MPKVSVIIPVYNVEKYLSRCVDSILNQTFSDFEIILVDDGSQDKSSEICDLYEKKYESVKVIHKQNEGVSVARNCGIESSEGEYITFIDSDDYVLEDYLQQLLSNTCELIVCGYTSVNESTGEIIGRVLPENFYFNGKLNIDYAMLYRMNIMYGPCSKLFRRDIIINNNLRFPVNISLGEDTMFVAEYLKYAKTAYMCNYAGYIYNTVEESFSLSNKTSYETLDMLTISRDFVLSIIDNISPEAALEIRKNTLSNISWYLEKLLLSKMSFQEKKHILNHYLENKYVIETLQDVDKYYNSTRVRRLLSSGNIREIIKSFTKMKRKAKYKQLKHNIRRALCRK